LQCKGPRIAVIIYAANEQGLFVNHFQIGARRSRSPDLAPNPSRLLHKIQNRYDNTASKLDIKASN